MDIREKLCNRRWKCFLVGYVIGYLFSLLYTGAPSLSYYIPIKIGGLFMGWLGAPVIYEANENRKQGKKTSIFRAYYLGIKYGISGFIICFIVGYIIAKICGFLGINSDPFLRIV